VTPVSLLCPWVIHGTPSDLVRAPLSPKSQSGRNRANPELIPRDPARCFLDPKYAVETGKAGFGSSIFLLLSFLADVVSYILASYAYGPKIWRQNVLKWPKDGTPGL
jgi:hypothetical protein